MAKLRPRARIVRTIGDQLISGPEAALIELVKNSFDADSPWVKIKIIPRSDSSLETAGIIYVADAGHGMSADDLISKWLEPATTDKVERKSSPGNRRLLGAKGVGRFATARLGRFLSLTCAKKVSDVLEVSEINIDWNEFEENKYLDEIHIDVQTEVGQADGAPGVWLKISDLRDNWTKAQLELLVRELRRLASPDEARHRGFKIFLDISEFSKDVHGFEGPSLLGGVFKSEDELYADDISEIKPFSIGDVYHYRLEGSFDESGAFDGAFINQRADGQKRNISIPASVLAEDERTCGPVSIALNIYDREGDAIVDLLKKLGLGSVGRMDARKILDENIGVGIYRNGFRIRPYGDADSDWLELERKRVQNPSQKLGLNQLWGVISICDEQISGLVERSSREGLEHNGAFLRLRNLIADVMTRVEAFRVEFREMVGISRRPDGDTGGIRTQATLQATTKAIASLPPQYRDRIQRALKQESAALRNSLEELEAYQHKLAAQSSLGLVVSQMLHDGRRFLGDINTRSKLLADGAPRLLEESAFGTTFRDSFGKNARLINDSAGHLTKLFKALDPLASRKRGRPKSLNPMDVVDRCLGFFSDSMLEHKIEVKKDTRNNLLEATVYEADLMAAILNILDNAVHWLSVSPVSPRQIRIQVGSSKKFIRVAVSNNGPLIDSTLALNLFKPGFTLKSEGSGLGLAIAREAMSASKGKVEYDVDADFTTFVVQIQRS